MKKIAIQGFKGSFHDIAAHRYFCEDDDIQPICCDTFEQVFENIKRDPTVIGMVAIENTIAGSLLHNYELLRESDTTIIGEHKLRIQHCICCLPNDSWSTVKEVHSHPVALMQCRGFLANHPEIKAVEAQDTAGAAQHIAEMQCNSWAAICHADAACMHGMKILQDSIEDNKHNFTRFLVVCHKEKAERHRKTICADKASLVFALPHEEGCLSQVLSILSFYKINLTKIQSLPIIGHEWEYLFYVDITFDDYIRYKQSVEAIRPLTKELNFLGEYKDDKNDPNN